MSINIIQNHRLLSRRGIIKNAALMTLLTPVLRRRDAHGAVGQSPRRVILIFTPNGPMNAAGPATGTETAFAMHDWWKAYDRHKADGIFLSHMSVTGAGVVAGNGHGLGGQTYSGFGSGANGDMYANKGPTIDQVIGKRLEAEGRAGLKRSVVWGNVSNNRGGGTGDAFCASAGRNITPEMDPSKAWAELFAAFMAPNPTEATVKRAAALLAREQSVLDFVNQDCKSMQDVLGAEGTRLMDDHCTSLRTMEKNLRSGGGAVAGMCTKPANPGAKDWPNPENIDVQTSAFIDLAATTLACELSHVIAFQFGAQGARNRLAGKYGVPSSPQADSGDSGPSHHPWTHQGNSESKRTAMKTFTSFYATQVALLVDKLKLTRDAMGKPLLDSTMVLVSSELGGSETNGDAHITGAMPVALFGSGQGTFKTGRYIRGKSSANGSGGAGGQEAGRDMAKLLVSLIQYMGLSDVSTVGVTGVKGRLETLHG